MPPSRPIAARRSPAPLALAAALLGSACSASAEPPRNLLLVTIDTTRADRIGCYGNRRASTPTLDALAARGALFETCIAPTPTTLPSHASILTGLYPYHHGARNNGTHHLGEDVTTLAERLAARGFATGAVVSARVLDARYGLDQGFESYDDDLSGSKAPDAFMVRETPADHSVDRALEWIDGTREDEPFFLWLHLFDPHANYAPPEPFASRFPRSPYDGEIAFADDQIGRLLGRLDEEGRLDDTLVVVTADHGESLLEHGEPTHGVFVYDATTRVPLILAHDSLAAGRRVGGITTSVDVVPTVLELLDQPPVTGLDGLSLAPLLRGGEAGAPARDAAATVHGRRAYCESLLPLYNNGWSDLRSLRGEGWRYVRAPRPELYDLARDPRELANVVDRHPDVRADWARDLDERLEPVDLETLGDDIGSMDPEDLAMLHDLGYVTRRPADSDLESEDLPDPKDMAEIMLEEYRARQLLQDARFEEALPIYERLAEEDPYNTFTLASYSMALAECDRLDEAMDVMEQLLTLDGARAENYVNLARLRRTAGRDDWREPLKVAQKRFPRQAIAWSWEGLWSVQDARFHEARRLLEKALEIDPDAVDAWGGLGQVEFHLGNLKEAERRLRRAREIDPFGEGVLYYLALLLERTGRHEEAIEVYEEALAGELGSQHLYALVNCGTLAGRYGDPERGEELLRKALDIDPTHYGARLNLGVLLVSEGRAAEGAELLQECVRRQPERDEAWFPLFAARRETGPPAALLEAAEGVLRRDPRRTDVLIAAAEASVAEGEPAAAEDYLRRARALDAVAVDEALRDAPALRELAPPGR